VFFAVNARILRVLIKKPVSKLNTFYGKLEPKMRKKSYKTNYYKRDTLISQHFLMKIYKNSDITRKGGEMHEIHTLRHMTKFH